MKICLFCTFLLASQFLNAQPVATTQNVFIITIDGFRWQEVFKGADSALMLNTHCVSDTSLLKQQYWDDCIEKRRTRLLPFFWNVIAKQGQLLGNRAYGNDVNVANRYKISSQSCCSK